jgi:hypothetical protein
LISERTSEGWVLRVKPEGVGRFGGALFLAVWLCGWAFGEFAVLSILGGGAYSVLTGNELGGNIKAIPPGTALGVGAFLLAVLWVLRSLLESRRWNRAAKTQAEIHTKLLDRFGSSQEMLAYMQTEAGKRFLESGTVTYESDSPRRTPQLLTRILFSIQAGLVLFLLGVGLIWLRPRIASGGEALLVLGTLALALGGGFVLSAVVSYVLSKRLGLLPATPSPDRA